MVAAPGPSLTAEAAEEVKRSGWPVVVVQDAWRLLPWADVLYGCDSRWWDHHEGVPEFKGEKWSTHDVTTAANDKQQVAEKYGVNLVRGARADEFSFNPKVINYGDNSGFQAVNLGILMGARVVIMVGFDMRDVGGKAHFFGQHPPGLHRTRGYDDFIKRFKSAAQSLPNNVLIYNATPGSALDCFPILTLRDAFEVSRDSRLYRHRAFSDDGADSVGTEQGV